MTSKKDRQYFKKASEPTMSDTTILLKVEDLINIAMGPPDLNRVNFKMLQTVLHILARQMRMLEQQVEIRIKDGLDDVSVSSEGKEEKVTKERRKSRPRPQKGEFQEKEERKQRSRSKSERGARDDIGAGKDDRDADREKEGWKDDRRKSGVEKGRKSESREGGGGGARDIENRDLVHQDVDDGDQSGSGKKKRKDKDRGREDDRDRDGGKGGSDRDDKRKSRDDRGRGRDDKDRGRDDDRGGEDSRGRDEDRARDDRSLGRDDKSERGRGEKGESKSRSKSRDDRDDRDAKDKSKGKDDKSGDRDDKDRGKDGGSGSRRDRGRDDKDDREDTRSERGGSEKLKKDDKDRGISKDRKEKDRDDETRDRDHPRSDDERGKDKKPVKGDKVQVGKRDEDDFVESGKKRSDKSGGKKDDDKSAKDSKSPNRYEEGVSGGEGKDRDPGKTVGDRAKGKDQGEKDVTPDGKGAKIPTGGRSSAETIKSAATTKSVKSTKSTIGSGSAAGASAATARPSTDGRAPLKPTRVGSIEVVTQSQFKIIEAAVKALEEKAGPIPVPTLPDNAKLRSDIAKGSATLTDTMEAMQVAARVQAAEKAIDRMAELLQQLAASGALPAEVAGKAVDIRAAADAAVAAAASIAPKAKGTVAGGTEAGGAGGGAPGGGEARKLSKFDKSDAQEKKPASAATAMLDRGKSVAIDPISAATTGARLDPVRVPGGARPSSTPGQVGVRVPSVAHISAGQTGRPSTLLTHMSVLSGVTAPEMDEALRGLREDMARSLNTLTSKATTAAEIAITTAKAVADKLDVALKLDQKITALNIMVADYAEQLSGFDAGLSTQMQGFQEQMVQMRSDLTAGIKQLEQVNNNAETAAILELTERHDQLVSELDATLHSHQQLTGNQGQLSEELRSLVECVEMLREQKADREEVQDGLRDKADLSRLAGLLTETDFSHARCELELRMQLCHEKFRKQDHVWMDALKDFGLITGQKAELMQLHALRDVTLEALRDLHEKVQLLTRILGDPKAAVITRRLAANATCGACGVPALMDPVIEGGPPLLPVLPPPTRGAPGVRPQPPGAPASPQALDESDSDSDYLPETHSRMCVRVLPKITHDRTKEHICRRWVGGSHTLMSTAIRRERAAPAPPPPLYSRRYVGAGSDGRQYRLERELHPCHECNVEASEKEPPEGAEYPDKIPGVAEASPGAAGDQGGRRPTLVSVADARRVTIIDDTSLRVLQNPATDETTSYTREVYTAMSRTFSSKSVAKLERRASISGDRKAIAAAVSDLTPVKSTDIGTIVKGTTTFVDDDDALRAVVKHGVATRRMSMERDELGIGDDAEATEAA